MIKNVFKAIILGLFIVLCIWQTGILWLGNVSSHNFLPIAKKVGYFALPEGIWVVKTGSYTLAFPINETKNEYKRLVEELAITIEEGIKSTQLTKASDTTYSKLLSGNGILFDYAVPVSLDQIAGVDLTPQQTTGMIDTVFVDMVDSGADFLHIYFIDSDNQLFYKGEFYGKFEFFTRIKDIYSNEEATANIFKYQPGATSGIKDYIKEEKTYFLPAISMKTPLLYTVLTSHNPLEETAEEERLSKLKEYVNPFFLNPFIVNIEHKSNGDIVFADNISLIVKYSPSGTMEYKNTSSNEEGQLYTAPKSFNKAMQFIMETKSIPQYIKDGMYLSDVVQNDNDFTFYFETRYDGYKIEMREALKNRLGVKAFVEVNVSNGIVNRAKWVILDVEPKDVYEVQFLTDNYQEPVEKMLSSRQVQDRLLLDDLRCVYAMNAVNRDIHVNWMAVYNGTSYYP